MSIYSPSVIAEARRRGVDPLVVHRLRLTYRTIEPELQQFLETRHTIVYGGVVYLTYNPNIIFVETLE